GMPRRRGRGRRAAASPGSGGLGRCPGAVREASTWCEDPLAPPRPPRTGQVPRGGPRPGRRGTDPPLQHEDDEFMGKLRQLCQDDQGGVLARYFLFLVTFFILGLVVGLSPLRTAINAELPELGTAILPLNLSFSFSGLTGCCPSVPGSQVIDTPGPLLVPPIC